MRVVLYADEDLEPITVVDLPPFARKHLEEHGTVSLAVIPPVSTTPIDRSEPILNTRYRVDIYAEMFVRRGQRHMMLVTRDEDTALLLKSAFLPGQRRVLQEHEREAFAKGFLSALNKLGAV